MIRKYKNLLHTCSRAYLYLRLQLLMVLHRLMIFVTHCINMFSWHSGHYIQSIGSGYAWVTKEIQPYKMVFVTSLYLCLYYYYYYSGLIYYDLNPYTTEFIESVTLINFVSFRKQLLNCASPD